MLQPECSVQRVCFEFPSFHTFPPMFSPGVHIFPLVVVGGEAKLVRLGTHTIQMQGICWEQKFPMIRFWLTMIYQAFVNTTIGQAMSGKQVSWRASPANVASWLVARLAIVARNFQIIQNPWLNWKFHYCGKIFWQTIFVSEKCLCGKQLHTFPEQNLACLPFQKGSDRCFSTLVKEQLFHKCPRHWTKALGPVHFSRFVF